jgi:glutathione peroxidase
MISKSITYSIPFLGFLGYMLMSMTPSITKLVKPIESVYNLSVKSIEGEAINISQFKGKKILFVNVASKCGFTRQYSALQTLHERFKDQLIVVGVPCNQFMNQEPGSNEQIAEFCERNYGVSFLITEKVDVKGSNQHPLYKWLTSASQNGSVDSKVNWNFQKYLVDETGRLLEIFPSNVDPMDDRITSLVK